MKETLRLLAIGGLLAAVGLVGGITLFDGTSHPTVITTASSDR